MSDEPKKRIGRWKEGESGNPSGRPRDERKQQLRQALLDAMPDVLNELISQARSGEPAAMKMILDRVIPTLKATSPTVTVYLPNVPPDQQVQYVLNEVVEGRLAPDQGGDIVSIIERGLKIREVVELEQRISALEQRHG